MSDHERWADAAGAYVLGAMADGERRRYEAHLAECDVCRDEVEHLRPAAEALPVASPPLTPPPALKRRVMAEVEREAALLAAAGPAADRPPRRRPLRGWRLPAAAAAVLGAGVLAGFAIGGLGGDDGMRMYPVEIDRAQAPDAHAELQVHDGEAMLMAEGLPMPPAGRVYQVWIMRPGSPDPVPTQSMFMPRSDGSAAAAVPAPLSEMEEVMVTHEPSGGSRRPTQRPLLSAPM